MEKKNYELKYYLILFSKNIKFVVIVTLIVIILSTIINFFILPPIFKGSCIIQVPLIGGDYLPNFTPQDVLTLIRSNSFLLEISNRTSIPFEELYDSINSSLEQNSKLIKVDFENKTKEKINIVFEAILSYLNEVISDPYFENYSLIETQIKNLEEKTKFLYEEEERIYKIINDSTKYKDLINIIFLDNLYNSIISKRISLDNQLLDLKKQITNSNMFKYIGKPLINNNPIKPNKIFNISFSGLSSFLISIFIVFLNDYIKDVFK